MYCSHIEYVCLAKKETIARDRLVYVKCIKAFHDFSIIPPLRLTLVDAYTLHVHFSH